ncbi:hypothetical protein CDIMF43_280110 [Carnobacterium divergens]|nr:hypothetical protein CDIV41_140301 [Carnobacterium divergens]SPC41216.1 hypothetical protein CDIMF43_280110 [Carnobacterium divergens]
MIYFSHFCSLSFLVIILFMDIILSNSWIHNDNKIKIPTQIANVYAIILNSN